MTTILAVALFCLITVVAVPGNLLVLLTFVLKKRLHQTRYLLLASLALSDLLFQFLVNIFKIASVAHQEWIFGHSWCQISTIIADICYRSTMLHLCATTIEAYVPLIRPLSYQRNITRTELMWLVCLWVVPAVCSVAGWKFKVYNPAVFGCQQAWDNDSFVNRVNILATALVFFLIPLIIIVSLQIMIWRIARRFAKAVLPLLIPTPPLGLQVHHGIPLALPVRHSDCRNTRESKRSRTPDSELPRNEISDRILPNLLQKPRQINNEPASSKSENENIIPYPGKYVEIILDKDNLQPHDIENRDYHGNSAFSTHRPEQSVNVVEESKVGTGTNIREIEREKSPKSRPCSRNRKLDRNSLQPTKSKHIRKRPWIPGGGKHLSFHHGVKPSTWRRCRGNSTKVTHVISKPYIEELDRVKISSGEFVPSNVCKTETDAKIGKCHIIEAEIHFDVNTRHKFPPSVFEYSVISSSNICNYDPYNDNNVLGGNVDQVDFIKDNNTGIVGTKKESIGSIDNYSGIVQTNKENSKNETEINISSSNCSNDSCSVGELIKGCVIAKNDNVNKHNDSVNDINDHDLSNEKLNKHFDISRRNEEKGDVQHVKNKTKDNEKKNVVNNTTTIKRRMTDLRASRDIFIVTSVFILCFLPLWVGAFYKENHPTGQLPDQVELICQWFAYASTFCNPIIYCIRKREFRRALAKLVRHVTSKFV